MDIEAEDGAGAGSGMDRLMVTQESRSKALFSIFSRFSERLKVDRGASEVGRNGARESIARYRTRSIIRSQAFFGAITAAQKCLEQHQDAPSEQEMEAIGAACFRQIHVFAVAIAGHRAQPAASSQPGGLAPSTINHSARR